MTLAILPSNMEVCAPAPVKQEVPVVHSKLPRIRALKTMDLPALQPEEVLHSASIFLPTPTSEILCGHPLKILIAPSGFKESLGPEHVADAIEVGCRRVLEEEVAVIRKLPLHDGGEGFARALIAAMGGTIVEQTVTGPVGLPVQSHIGYFHADRKQPFSIWLQLPDFASCPRNCAIPP